MNRRGCLPSGKQRYHLGPVMVSCVLISDLSCTTGLVKLRKKLACPDAANPDRKRTANSPTEANEVVVDETDTGGNHDKYCHFCQHVKVRASAMLACENLGCSRRFCEHCLLTHLGEDVDPMSSDAWEMVDGKVCFVNSAAARLSCLPMLICSCSTFFVAFRRALSPAGDEGDCSAGGVTYEFVFFQACWNCPICRKRCCCSVIDCSVTHRHCKAYRYRRRRAELALKHAAVLTDKRAGLGKKEAPKKTSGTASARLLPAYVDYVLNELSTVDTTSASVDDWTGTHGKRKPWTMQHTTLELDDSEDKAYSINSVVGTPHDAAHCMMPTAGLQQRMHDELLRGLRGDRSYALGADDDDVASPSMLLCLYAHSDLHEDDDEMAALHTERHTSISAKSQSIEVHWENGDEIMASVLGHMLDTADLDESSSDVSHLGWPAQVLDLLPFDALLHEAEMRARQLPEVDEVEWLRRTYETVYNPGARRRVLDHMVSSNSTCQRAATAKDERPGLHSYFLCV